MNNYFTSSLFFIASMLISGCTLGDTTKVSNNDVVDDAKNNIVKILPLGDSITCASKYKVSYRYPLWKLLIDSGKQIEFVGSQTKKGNGSREWDTYKGKHFPEKNEGHSGWRADQVLNGLRNGEKGMDDWITNYNPDIALIHLGTNDIHQKQSPESTRDDIHNIIKKLRNKNPKIKIIIAEIIPVRDDKTVILLNQLLAQLAKNINQPDSPVISVDMYSGFNSQTDMQKDKMHPNASGEIKMATHWFNALMNKQMLGTID